VQGAFQLRSAGSMARRSGSIVRRFAEERSESNTPGVGRAGPARDSRQVLRTMCTCRPDGMRRASRRRRPECGDRSTPVAGEMWGLSTPVDRSHAPRPKHHRGPIRASRRWRYLRRSCWPTVTDNTTPPTNRPAAQTSRSRPSLLHWRTVDSARLEAKLLAAGSPRSGRDLSTAVASMLIA